MKFSKNKTIISIWVLYYQIIIPILVTILMVYLCWKHKIYLWNAKYYIDMLTALITFLSIIISVFGILIPTVFTSKSDGGLIQYFLDSADMKYFVKSIKRVIAGGIVDVLFVCILYAQDIIPRHIYVGIAILCFYVLVYFLCGSYKYISVMLRLTLETREPYEGKKYMNKMTDEKKRNINEMLRQKYENKK